MRLLQTMLQSHSKHQLYISCAFKLRTYDAMLTSSVHHIKENDIDVMRDKMTSMTSIWHMAEHKEMIHIIGFNISVGPHGPSSTLAYKTANPAIEKHGLQI